MSEDDFDLHDPAPADETPEDRKKRLARIRQRKKRSADAQAALRGGAKDYPFEAYAGTQSDIAQLCQLGGFEEFQEMFTVVLRNLADLAARDSHAVKQYLAIPSRKDATK